MVTRRLSEGCTGGRIESQFIARLRVGLPFNGAKKCFTAYWVEETSDSLSLQRSLTVAIHQAQPDKHDNDHEGCEREQTGHRAGRPVSLWVC